MDSNFLPRQPHLDFLTTVRAYELDLAKQYFPESTASCSLLELGAGTGAQAKQLSKLGYNVTALDVANSHYRNVRCFDIQEYDGISIPLPNCSHDVVFSSHVLEHVVNLDAVLDETHRVLKDDGVCVHLIPTPMCRFWTLAAHYIWLVRRITKKLFSIKKDKLNHDENIPRTPKTATAWLWTIFPAKHGERGNTVSEIYYYSQHFWQRKFNEHGFDIIKVKSNGLFYTMANSLGHNVSMGARKRLAILLGNAGYVYVLKKKAEN